MKVKTYLPLLLLVAGIQLLGQAPVAETAKGKEAVATSLASRRAKRAERRHARQRDRKGRFKSAHHSANAALKEKLTASQTKSLQEVLSNVSGGGLQAVHGVIADHIKQLAKKEDLTVGQVLAISRALEREAAIAQGLAKRFTQAADRTEAYNTIVREYKDAQRIVLPYVATIPAARNIHDRIERRIQKLEHPEKASKRSFKGARKERQAKRSQRREKRGDIRTKRRSERKERRKARHHKSDKAQAPVARA